MLAEWGMSNGDLAEDEIDEHGDIVDFNLTIVIEVGVDAERELILVEHCVLTRPFSPAGVNVKVSLKKGVEMFFS